MRATKYFRAFTQITYVFEARHILFSSQILDYGYFENFLLQ